MIFHLFIDIFSILNITIKHLFIYYLFLYYQSVTAVFICIYSSFECKFRETLHYMNTILTCICYFLTLHASLVLICMT